MHLRKFEITNFKSIKKFEKEFAGSIYFFTGDNAVGKSTLMNAIFTLITGNTTKNMLTNGEKKGSVKGQFVGDNDDEYQVELVYSEKNPLGKIKITKDGMTQTTKSFLQSVFKYRDFDASEFISLSKTAEGRRKQIDTVKSLLPEKEVKRLNEIEVEILTQKEARKEFNTSKNHIEGILNDESIDEDFLVEFKNPLVINDLLEIQNKKIKRNQEISEFKGKVDAVETALVDFDSETENAIKNTSSVSIIEVNLENAENELLVAQKKVQQQKQLLEAAKQIDIDKKAESVKVKNELQEKAKKGNEWLSENPVYDLTEIEENISNVSDHNSKNALVVQYLSNKEKLDNIEASIKDHNDKIDSLTSEKSEIIKNSELPIDGIEFDDNGITLNGVPFVQGEVSTSEEMEVAFAIIAATNKDTKMFRIARGESLGGKKLKQVIDFANKNGYQGFIEQVVPFKNELTVHEYSEVEK